MAQSPRLSVLSINQLFILLLFILTPLSILITGYGIFLENHAMQLPLVYMTNSPGKYFAGDPFAQSLPKYGAPVWHLTAFLIDKFDQEYVLAILFVITRILAIASAGLLARALVPASRLAMAAAMAFVASNPESLVGTGTILEKMFEHTSLAVPFFVMALAAVVARRAWLWAAAWVLGFFCNPMYGVFASVYLGFLVLCDRELRANWRAWLKPLIVALALIAPFMLWSLIKMRPGPFDHEIWLKVNLLRIAHHMDPFSWPRLNWLLTLTLISLCGFSAFSTLR